MKLSGLLTYLFFTVAATAALVGAWDAAGHRWWSLAYAAAAFVLIFGWDSLSRRARKFGARWTSHPASRVRRPSASSLAAHRNHRRAA